MRQSIAPRKGGEPPGSEAGLSLTCSCPAACSSHFLGCRDQLEHPEEHHPRDPRQGGAFLDAATVVAVCVNHHGAQAQILPISQSFVDPDGHDVRCIEKSAALSW